MTAGHWGRFHLADQVHAFHLEWLTGGSLRQLNRLLEGGWQYQAAGWLRG
jgi:hypothetical protein